MENQRYPDTDADRRAYPRSPVVVREARLISGMEVFFGYAQNISRSGLFIATSKKRAVGELYEIQFAVPGTGREIKCKGKVVWSRPYRSGGANPPGFGLEFVELGADDQEFLTQWVEETMDKN